MGGGRRSRGGAASGGGTAESVRVGWRLWPSTPRPSSSSARSRASSTEPRSRGRSPGTVDGADDVAPGAAAPVGLGSLPRTTMRSASWRASSTSWVTSSTVVGSARWMSSSRSCILIRVSASSAPNGSSSSSTPGLRARARASEVRWAMPPEISRGGARRSRPAPRGRAAGPPLPCRPGRCARGQADRHVGLQGAPRQEARFLEGEGAAGVDALDGRAADMTCRTGGVQPGGGAQQRRLAAAGGAEDGQDLAGADLEVNVAQDGVGVRAGTEGPAQGAEGNRQGRGAGGGSGGSVQGRLGRGGGQDSSHRNTPSVLAVAPYGMSL